MYREFYGFKEIPFGLTPNPKYIFKTDSYLEVTANLRYCISHYKGLVVVTGEVGTGKTTTLRSMMQQLGHEILTVYMVNPFLTVPEFYELLIQGLRLGIAPGSSKTQVLHTLALIQRGQDRFRDFCTPGHSELGDGNGTIVQRGFSPPQFSLAVFRLRQLRRHGPRIRRFSTFPTIRHANCTRISTQPLPRSGRRIRVKPSTSRPRMAAQAHRPVRSSTVLTPMS